MRGLSCKPNIYVSWSTSELRVRLAPLNRFKPSSKIFYWPFQGGTSFVDLLCFCSVLCLLCFVRVCLYVLCGHLLGKGWPLGSRLWCLLWVCHFPIGILGQVWYLIVSIPDLCTITYFWTWCDVDLRIPILTSAPPQSILVLSGQHHVISNVSIVNNCIMSNASIVKNCILDCIYTQYQIGNITLIFKAMFTQVNS